MKLVNLMLITGLVMTSSAAFAGVDSGGGDAVVAADGSVKLLDLEESDQIAYFEPQSESYFKDSNNKFSVENILRIDDRYEGSGCHGKLPWILNSSEKYPSVYPVAPNHLTWAFSDVPLEKLRDEGQIKYRGDGQIQQVAIQYKNENIVVVYRPLFEKMDDKNKSALILHEGFVRMALDLAEDQLQAKGTSPIRNYNRLLFLFADGKAPTDVVKLASDRLGIGPCEGDGDTILR